MTSFWLVAGGVPLLFYGYTWLLENQSVWVPKVRSALPTALSVLTWVQSAWNGFVTRSRFQNTFYVVYNDDIHGHTLIETSEDFLTDSRLSLSWVFNPLSNTLYKTPIPNATEERAHHYLPYLAGTIRIEDPSQEPVSRDISDFLANLKIVYSGSAVPTVPPMILLECSDMIMTGVTLYSINTNLFLDVITDEGEEVTFDIRTGEMIQPSIEIPESSDSSGPESTDSASGEAVTETPPSEREASDSAESVPSGDSENSA